jgi:hypothetical protein
MNDRTTPLNPWGHGFDVNRLADRLDELADYVTQGADCVRRNFVMRVPAEPYHDADLVISAAARLLRDGPVAPPSPAQPAAWPVNLDELHDPDFSDGLTASQHLDVLRGGPDPRADQAKGPSLAEIGQLCKEFGFQPGSNGALLWADTFRAPPQDPLQALQEMIAAAIARWRNWGSVAGSGIKAAIVNEFFDTNQGPRAAATASPGLPPRVGHIVRLAEIIREVDGKHDLSAAALAEAILAHPGFSGCHDGPVASAAQGEVAELVAALEADAECVEVEHYDLCNMTADQMRRIAHLLKTSTQPADIDPGFTADLLRYEFSVHDNYDVEVAGGDAATFGEVLAEGRHYLSQYSQDGPHKLEFRCVQVMDYSEPTHA